MFAELYLQLKRIEREREREREGERRRKDSLPYSQIIQHCPIRHSNGMERESEGVREGGREGELMYAILRYL